IFLLHLPAIHHRPCIPSLRPGSDNSALLPANPAQHSSTAPCLAFPVSQNLLQCSQVQKLPPVSVVTSTRKSHSLEMMQKLCRPPRQNCAPFATQLNPGKIWKGTSTSYRSFFWLLASGFWLLASTPTTPVRFRRGPYSCRILRCNNG